ncbi:MAG: type II toxin-antitoxin system RelE/ParE family toxin [Comamonadaceae bacterium]|nr:MAG: type II toxin-antitoxin system RelE/ParE family toxin [Comamonadaceae bacterium]
MSFIKYSNASRADLVRLHAFLEQYDSLVADKAIDTIIDSIGYIGENPSSGTPLVDRQNVRKSVIEFGASGYLFFHKRYEKKDMNFVTRIIHQKEWYEAETIGLVEERTKETKA